MPVRTHFCVHLPRSSMPTAEQWAEAIGNSGFPVAMEADFDVDSFVGFVPCRYEGIASEFWYHSQSEQGAETEAPAGCDFSVFLEGDPEFREVATVLTAASVLCHLSGGLLINSLTGDSCPAESVLDWVRVELVHLEQELDPSPGLTETKWLLCREPGPLLTYLRGTATERQRRLFACACCRRVWDLMEDPSRRLVECVERFVDGLAHASELRALWARAPFTGPFSTDAVTPRNDAADAAWYAAADDQCPCSCDGLDSRCEQCHGSGTVSGADQCSGAAALALSGAATEDWLEQRKRFTVERRVHTHVLRDIVGNPFRASSLSPECLSWNDGCVGRIAQTIYQARGFEALPFLCDAYEAAGGNDVAIIRHLREPGEHVRGCWVIDQAIGRGGELSSPVPDGCMDLAFITEHWPQLATYIPDSAVPQRRDEILDGIRIDGYCNSAANPPDRWLGRTVAFGRSPNFATDAQVPPGYFACGIHLAGNFSEYLFVMWERDGRRFWFYNRYFSTGNPEGHSTIRAAVALDVALAQWEGGATTVMYHGDWGWFIPEINDWAVNPG